MLALNQQKRMEFRVNDVVAIVRWLPWGREVITITKVKRVGATLIETVDNQLFFASDGESLNGRLRSYIELATPGDLAAVDCDHVIR